jgi:hypothetical protein
VPAWLRRAVADAQTVAGKEIEDIALVAGAAIGALDAVVRREERWAGARRQRLALATATVSVKQAGRVGYKAALRDAVLLTRPGFFVRRPRRPFAAWLASAGSPAGGRLADGEKPRRGAGSIRLPPKATSWSVIWRTISGSSAPASVWSAC